MSFRGTDCSRNNFHLLRNIFIIFVIFMDKVLEARSSARKTTLASLLFFLRYTLELIHQRDFKTKYYAHHQTYESVTIFGRDVGQTCKNDEVISS